MGLALPAEVGEAAALALHHHWPQVDEDTLSIAATAYRDTATALASAAGDADRHTQQVLAVSRGGLASGLRSAAGRVFGTQNSDVATTTTHCTSLAQGLTADAGAVRQTKRLITDELCALTENLAALRTAGPTSGGATQLMIPQAVSVVSANIEGHYQRLASALGGRSDAGHPRTPLASRTASVGATSAGGGPLAGRTPDVAAAADNLPSAHNAPLLGVLPPLDAAAVGPTLSPGPRAPSPGPREPVTTVAAPAEHAVSSLTGRVPDVATTLRHRCTAWWADTTS